MNKECSEAADRPGSRTDLAPATCSGRAPFSLHANIDGAIEAETRAAQEESAPIIAKMNSLLEPETIAALYGVTNRREDPTSSTCAASITCALGSGAFEHIRSRSIIGRLLGLTPDFSIFTLAARKT